MASRWPRPSRASSLAESPATPERERFTTRGNRHRRAVAFRLYRVRWPVRKLRDHQSVTLKARSDYLIRAEAIDCDPFLHAYPFGNDHHHFRDKVDQASAVWFGDSALHPLLLEVS